MDTLLTGEFVDVDGLVVGGGVVEVLVEGEAGGGGDVGHGGEVELLDLVGGGVLGGEGEAVFGEVV